MNLYVLASDVAVEVVAVAGGITIAIVAMVMSHRRKVRQIEAVEESRREIAAYVAEGSITPTDAERLMNAGPTPKDQAKQG